MTRKRAIFIGAIAAAATAEHFAATINQLKGQVTMLFITHALPKNLLVDEVVRIGHGGWRQWAMRWVNPGKRPRGACMDKANTNTIRNAMKQAMEAVTGIHSVRGAA